MHGSHPSLTSQRGVSLSGLIVVFGIIIVLAMLALKIIPFLIEYKASKDAIGFAKNTNGSVQEIRAAFDRNADINMIKSVSGRDLIITKNNGTTEVAFDYESKIPLLTNVTLLIHFAATTDKSGIIPEKPEVAPQ